MQVSIKNVINVSVSQSPSGINAYNTSNLALFTEEAPGTPFVYKIYKAPDEVATDFGSNSTCYKMALKVFSQTPNVLAPGGSLIIIPYESSETLAQALVRTNDLVQYFGIMTSEIETAQAMLDAAAVVQAKNKIAFFVQRNPSSITTGGSLDALRAASYYKSRGLYYGADNDLGALEMQAAYAGRALSTIFTGSRTTQTMNLKTLNGITPDPTINETRLAQAQDAGVDVYANFQGVAKVWTSGANMYFDQVYNVLAFVGDIEVAGFNYLAQTSTKIPQTENGMIGLKSAYRAVCEQYVTNGYIAPGVWNNPQTFGNQSDMFENIAQRGYYLYSTPIAQQLQAQREAREAPLVQLAIKEAGAVHKSSIIIYVNA